MAKRSSRRKARLSPTLLLVLLALVAGLVYLAVDQPPASPSFQPLAGNVLSVVVLDVGQGDSALVRAPSGRTMLVDAGGSERLADEVVIPHLRRLGVTRLDYLLLTHPHQDHVGGMPTVLKKLPVEVAVFSGQVSTNSAYRDFLTLVQQGKARAEKARRGGVLDMGEGVKAEVLNPPEKLFAEDNDNSVVVKITYGQVSFLLTGDAEAKASDSMIEAGLNLRSTVLKVSHHGSADGTGKSFLSAVSPRYALISVGAGNAFGHPHRETLGLLKERDVAVYRTDQHGTITVNTDGQSVGVATTRS